MKRLALLAASLAVLSGCATERLPDGTSARVYAGPSFSLSAGFLGATASVAIAGTSPVLSAAATAAK